jgi:hypothetical protein
MGSKIALLMLARVRPGNHGSECPGHCRVCGLAWTSDTRPGCVPHSGRRYARLSRSAGSCDTRLPRCFLVSRARYQATKWRFHIRTPPFLPIRNYAEVLSTPLLLSSGIATIIQLLIQNQLSHQVVCGRIKLPYASQALRVRFFAVCALTRDPLRSHSRPDKE